MMLESVYGNLGLFLFICFSLGDRTSSLHNCKEAIEKYQFQPDLSHRSIRRNLREDNQNYSNMFRIFFLPNSLPVHGF